MLSFDGVTGTGGGAVGWLRYEDDGVSIAYQGKSIILVLQSQAESSRL